MGRLFRIWVFVKIKGLGLILTVRGFLKIITFTALCLMLVGPSGLAIQVPNKEVLRSWLDKVGQGHLADDADLVDKLSKPIHDPIEVSVAVRVAVLRQTSRGHRQCISAIDKTCNDVVKAIIVHDPHFSYFEDGDDFFVFNRSKL